MEICIEVNGYCANLCEIQIHDYHLFINLVTFHHFISLILHQCSFPYYYYYYFYTEIPHNCTRCTVQKFFERNVSLLLDNARSLKNQRGISTNPSRKPCWKNPLEISKTLDTIRCSLRLPTRRETDFGRSLAPSLYLSITHTHTQGLNGIERSGRRIKTKRRNVGRARNDEGIGCDRG